MQEVIQENQEKEFLKSYEIKNWNFSPRIYKILAASAILNVAAIMVFAQTNLLTKKGCDSPFVRTVCSVIDTLYVGNTLFGADSDYVLQEYNKTKVGEDESYEVTMIDVSDRLTYPSDYFALANPEQYRLDEFGNVVPNNLNTFENVTQPGMYNPTNPVNPPSLMNTPQNLPPTNNNPTMGKVPTSPFSIENNPTLRGANKPRKGTKNPTLDNESPDKLPGFDGNETADKDPKDPKVDVKPADNSDPVKDVEINKAPFQDLGKFVATKWNINPEKNDNKIELKPFKVVLNAKLAKKEITDQDGKKREVVGFDAKKSGWANIPEQEAGDQEMVNIAKEAIEAVGDSGFLGHLYNLEMRDLKITLTQKDDKIFAAIESPQQSEERAKTLASGLNGLIGVAKLAVKGEDEKFLLNSAQTPTYKGKTIFINVELSRDTIQQMIVRKLAEEEKKRKEAESKKQTPSNSTAQTVNSNQNTGK